MENTIGFTSRKKVVTIIAKGIFYIAILILLLLLGAVSYLSDTWKELSYQEIMFHLRTSLVGTNPEMIKAGILRYGIPALLLYIFIVLGLLFLEKKKSSIKRVVSILVIIVLIIANGVSLYKFNANNNVITDAINAFTGNDESDFIGNNYVNPDKVSMVFPEEKRNLIYIYLESMEATYSDEDNGGAFVDNYIPNLTRLSEEYDNFSGNEKKINGGIALPGTQWTTGGMFAQSSGLPLQMPMDENTSNISSIFFPGLVTIGDILAKEGYTNILKIGSEAAFGAREVFYLQHGPFEIRDYNYTKDRGLIPDDYFVFWGYEDEKLFDFAKEELLELAKEDAPFNYTLLTVDTHFEDGYVCRLCEDEFGDNQYGNVIACSDRQVYNFIKWIQEQDFYDNTTIVINGDHTTMDVDFCESVNDDYQRKTYTCIINSAVEPEIDDYREFGTIDLFPTTLAALGVELSSDRVGCGTNLYGTQKTLIEEYGRQTCEDEFSKMSKFLMTFTAEPVTEEEIQAAKDNSYLEVAEENGLVRFRVYYIDRISYANIKDLTLRVQNKKTGKSTDYPVEIVRARTGWHGVTHTDISFEDLDNLDCGLYITVDKYKNYLLKEFTTEDFQLWDIRWDVD